MSGSFQHKSEFSEGPIIGSTLGYKVYSAILNQSGTSAPTATVFTNTLGGTIAWTYIGVGQYRGTISSTTFPQDKTFILQGGSDNPYFVTIYRKTSNYVVLYVNDTAGNPVDGGISILSIEIRIYP